MFVQRRQQAVLIRRIYEADPLVCPRCRGLPPTQDGGAQAA
jgi:hypothetical protein